MKRIKLQKSIFTKLIGGFFVFFALFLVTFTVCFLLSIAAVSDGNLENVMPYSYVDSYGNITGIEYLESLGGWIEELDDEYNVVRTYGEKKTDTDKYSQDALYDMISFFDEDEYLCFLSNPENNEHIFLIMYPRNNVTMQVNIMVDGNATSDANKKEWYFISLFFVLILLEMTAISIYLRKKIKTPLQQLAQGMERIQSGEDNVVLDIKTEAEFEQIVETFNTMTHNLAAEKQENQRLIEQKNQLLLELSHDLRTPIATIKSYASALEDGLVPFDKIKSYYHTIGIKADRVKQLSDDMFFMLKADNPNDKLSLEKTDICEFLRKICAEQYDETESAGFIFEIDITEKPIPIMLDLRLFSRVIENLLSNARKYNTKGSVIGIECYQNKNEVTIKVSDDGEKLDDELSCQMFTAFVRGDKTRSSSGGTGLGLSISKIITERHGGTISYKRENERNVFELKLPLNYF